MVDRHPIASVLQGMMPPNLPKAEFMKLAALVGREACLNKIGEITGDAGRKAAAPMSDNDIREVLWSLYQIGLSYSIRVS